MSSRFVAGTSVEEVLNAAVSVNRQGISTTLDSLGENVHSPHEAHLAAEVYHRLLDAIQQRQLDANVSVKLTQMGMDLDPELASAMAASLVEHAVEATCRFARERGIASDQFEFQMLYGVRRDLQKSLVAQGYRVRVYIPFGTEWYPYFMRRLAERPANLLFIARNFFRQ